MMFGANDYTWTATDMELYLKRSARMNPYRVAYYNEKYDHRTQLDGDAWAAKLAEIKADYNNYLAERQAKRRRELVRVILTKSKADLFGDYELHLMSLDLPELKKLHKRLCKTQKRKPQKRKVVRHKDIVKSLGAYGSSTLLDDYMLADTTRLSIKARPQLMKPNVLLAALKHPMAGVDTARMVLDLINEIHPTMQDKFAQASFVARGMLF